MLSTQWHRADVVDAAAALSTQRQRCRRSGSAVMLSTQRQNADVVDAAASHCYATLTTNIDHVT
jgi:hypothetical protein